MVVPALLIISTVAAAVGAGLGLLPTWRPENVRRELLALTAFRARGMKGDLKFPVYEWPPIPARINLIGFNGFRPGNLADDPNFPENQAIRHSIGRPEDVDRIGWDAAAKLAWTDQEYVSVAVMLLAFTVPLTIAGLLW